MKSHEDVKKVNAEPNELVRLMRMVRNVLHERGVGGLVWRVVLYVREYMLGLWMRSFFFAPREVLYISGCPGGARQYRCDHQMEVLNRAGVRASVVAQHNPHLRSIVKKFRIFVMQRTVWNERLEQVFLTLKASGSAIVFETDDLVFDPIYLPYMDYYHHMLPREKMWYENGIGREILEEISVKRCVVATDFLATAMKKKYPEKEIFVVYNTLGMNQVAIAKRALASKVQKRQDGFVRIGYFSGSHSHNRDFESVTPVLLRILRERQDVKLVLVGHLDVPELLAPVKSQIERIPFVPLLQLPALILSTDINIAPLEKENPFCQAKSALKFLEAGILGIPTVAAMTGDFVRCIRQGENGFVAQVNDEWYIYLMRLIKNREFRERIGVQARKDILAAHTTQSRRVDAEKLVAFLRGS